MLLQTQLPLLRPQTTAHLAQTMTLLGLTATELYQKIEAELATNPALELLEERYCPNCRRKLVASGPCPVCSQPRTLDNSDPIVFISAREYFQFSGMTSAEEEKSDDDFIADCEDLPTYVLRQIAPELDPQDYRLTVHILANLDEDGLLSLSNLEIAHYHHVPITRVENVLRIIQRADPVGVGAHSPQEALLVQLEALGETQAVPPLASKLITEGLELLGRRQYSELAGLLGVSSHKVREIAQFITQNLNPFPGRAHWGDIHQSTAAEPKAYYNPDVLIKRLSEKEEESPLVVEVISPLAGRLRVNPEYRQALQEAPEDKVAEWMEHYERASLLVKCLQQRNHTIMRLMARIAQLQRMFILKGDDHLEPVTRAQIAQELGVHESTISRAVANKTVQLPNGRIIPLKKFFDRSLHIRTEMLKIIEVETKPLTDTQIAHLLSERGYPIARRTVAKYRSIEGILPAHLRSSNRLAVA